MPCQSLLSFKLIPWESLPSKAIEDGFTVWSMYSGTCLYTVRIKDALNEYRYCQLCTWNIMYKTASELGTPPMKDTWMRPREAPLIHLSLISIHLRDMYVTGFVCWMVTTFWSPECILFLSMMVGYRWQRQKWLFHHSVRLERWEMKDCSCDWEIVCFALCIRAYVGFVAFLYHLSFWAVMAYTNCCQSASSQTCTAHSLRCWTPTKTCGCGHY